MSKIKEKKLKSIKSEIEEIKEYLKSSDKLDVSTKNDAEFLNNNVNDTLTLTNIVNEENKTFNYSDLDKIKNELMELKSAVYDNKDLLKKILLKFK